MVVKRLLIPYFSLFFLRTTFFNIRFNPILVVVLPFIAFFYYSGDLDTRAILFLMCLFCLTPLYSKKLKIYLSSSEKENTINIGHFYQLLPIPRKFLSISLMLSVFLYSLFIQVVLFAIFLYSNKLPPINDLTFTYDKKLHTSVITGTYEVLAPPNFNVMVTKPYKNITHPYITGGIVRDNSGWPFYPGYKIIFPIFFVTTTFFLLLRMVLSISFKSNIFHDVAYLSSLFSLTLFGMVLLADIFLPINMRAFIRLSVDSSNFYLFLPSVLLATVSFFNFVEILKNFIRIIKES